MGYFDKFKALNEVYDELRNAYPGQPIEEVRGHYNSPLVIVVSSYEMPFTQCFFAYLRKWLAQNPQLTRGAKFHQCCLLSYTKGLEGEDVSESLSKELTILSPKMVLSLVEFESRGWAICSVPAVVPTIFKPCNSSHESSFQANDEFRLDQMMEQVFKFLST